MKSMTSFVPSQIKSLLSNLTLPTNLSNEAIDAIAWKSQELTHALENPYAVAFALSRYVVGISQHPHQAIQTAVALATTFLACNDVSTQNTHIALLHICEVEADKTSYQKD